MFRRSAKPDRGRLPEGLIVYAIGDIHGRADLLNRLLTQIEADARGVSERIMLIFLGDYVDRGLESKGVLDIVCADLRPFAHARFLRGNHDEEMLSFLRDPERGPGWAVHGGAETLLSYGVTPPKNVSDKRDWERARAELAAALPAVHRRFLEKLELFITLGGYLFVHAGLRPGRRLENQDPADMLAIREPFLTGRAKFDHVVVHGHTPLDAPHVDDRRIGVDTGAFASNVLTAARLEGASRRFIQARGDPQRKANAVADLRRGG